MLAMIIILMGVTARLVGHAPNFTPVLALALFGGTYLPRRYALVTVMALMMVSDALLGFYPMIQFTWAGILLVTFLGNSLRRQKRPAAVLGSSLAAAVLFFIISNIGAWLALYPLTGDGLARCFAAALPFFRNTLLSTLVYTAVFFGVYELAAARIRRTAASPLWLTV